MRRTRLAGLNCRNILPKTVHSCLDDLKLSYNWAGKVRGAVLGICLARSTVLQDIARKCAGKVKKNEKALSEFLSHRRLDLRNSSKKHAIRVLRRIGKRRFLRYRGKLVLIVDGTTYVKMRSRGKEQRMPHIGKVPLHNVPSRETLLAPGYNELWTGLLLKDKTCLGITRRLFTETMLPRFSQNSLEEEEIQRAIELVEEAFDMKVIVVADRGFRRKELLEWLKKRQRTDFVIRLEGKLKVKAQGWEGGIAPDAGASLAGTLAAALARQFQRSDPVGRAGVRGGNPAVQAQEFALQYVVSDAGQQGHRPVVFNHDASHRYAG